MLLVISKQGLWEAHIWEEPSMGRFRRDSNGDIFAFQNPLPQDFQKGVIDLIDNGDGEGTNMF